MLSILCILKGLGDKNRLRIVSVLSKQNLCACQLISLLEISGASVSQHMSILINAKICSSQKKGRWVYFSLNKETPFIKEVLEHIQESDEFENDLKKIHCICYPETDKE